MAMMLRSSWHRTAAAAVASVAGAAAGCSEAAAAAAAVGCAAAAARGFSGPASAAAATSVGLAAPPRALPSAARDYAHTPRKGHRVAVILTEQLDNLGYLGEEVRVAPGYARNFLIPQHKAVYATAEARATKKVVLPEEEARAIAVQREVNMLRARIAGVRLKFARATTDGATLYSDITAVDVTEALAASVLRKLGIRERDVRFAGGRTTIHTTGDHTVEIQPQPALWCALTLTVESS